MPNETETLEGRPVHGTPDSVAFFREALKEVGETQSSLARLMTIKGDDRQPGTILRNIQRMALGEARVSGEMRVILTLLLAAKRAAKQQEEPGTSAALFGPPEVEKRVQR